MNYVSESGRRELPSAKSLVKASILAMLIAALLLVTVVLPAEYGIDPTGVGAGLGLDVMRATPADAASAPEEPGSVLGAVWKSSAPYRTDEMSLTLQPNEGAEIKASMRAGERMVFSWTAEGGLVNFDMHGEELNAAKDVFSSYWKGRNESSGHGAFEAPFPGTHGWYWRNRGKTSVTVRVKTSGYYEKLFKPGPG